MGGWVAHGGRYEQQPGEGTSHRACDVAPPCRQTVVRELSRAPLLVFGLGAGEALHMAKAAEGRNRAEDNPVDHALHDALRLERWAPAGAALPPLVFCKRGSRRTGLAPAPLPCCASILPANRDR